MQVNRVRNERIAQNAHLWNSTLGNTLIKDLSNRRWDLPTQSQDPEFWNFIHALNTSDWIAAAYFLFAGKSQILQRTCGTDGTLCFWMAKRYLDPLYQAADRFGQDRKEWQGQLQEAYQFGKLPADGPSVAEGESVAIPYVSKQGVVQHGRNLTRLIPIFQEYEKINQLYQRPGRTETGATIRFTQGHNWSYSHARVDLIDQNLFPEEGRRILINWDAHRDLSSPFRHLSEELAFLTKWMQIDKDRLLWLIRHGESREEIAEVSSMMSIAGWIIPLLYSRHFTHQEISETILVVPREAIETADNSYWPGYGTHTLGVGYAAIDFEEISELYQLLDQNKLHPASLESDRKPIMNFPDTLQKRLKNGEWKSLQSVSSAPQLQTISDEVSEIVQGIHNVKVHIMDPDYLDAIQKKIGNASVYLSVDVDFAGTTHLGGWYTASNPTPHYPLNRTEAEEMRHLQLINQFQHFYRVNAENIKAVSVANSPDYTAEEVRRRPAAKILEVLTANVSADQPDWLSGESNRVIPPQLQKHPARHLLVSLAGILGISITAALFWHYLRTKKNLDSRENTSD